MAIERIIPEQLEPNSPLWKEHVYRYLFALREIKQGEIVLDAACGVGYGSAMLAERAAEVIGIDISPAAIEYAEKHYQRENITYLVQDLDKGKLDFLKVHVAVCLETLEHLHNPQQFLEKLKRITQRAIILSTPIVPTKHVNPYHLHDWTREEIEGMMAPWAVKVFEQQDIYGLWVFQSPMRRNLDIFGDMKLSVEAEVIKGVPATA